MGSYKFSFWDDEHLKLIEEVLGMTVPELVKQNLQDAHRDFAIEQTELMYGPVRLTKTRKWLKDIIKITNQIDKLGDPDQYTDQVLMLALANIEYHSIGRAKDDFFKLRNRAEIALSRLPRKDRTGPNDSQSPLLNLVSKLRDIYEKITGTKPTLRKSIHNEPGGPFFDFVLKFLTIVGDKPHSPVALARIIERVIYPPNSKKNS